MIGYIDRIGLLIFLLPVFAVMSLIYCSKQEYPRRFYLAACLGVLIVVPIVRLTSIIGDPLDWSMGICYGVLMAACFKKPKSRRIGSIIGMVISVVWTVAATSRHWITAFWTITVHHNIANISYDELFEQLFQNILAGTILGSQIGLWTGILKKKIETR